MKRNYVIAGIVAASLVAGAGVATAQGKKAHGRMGPMMPAFSELDANGDGNVTKAEMEAHAKARFDAADTDGNGKLSQAEMKAAAEKRAEEARQRRFERMAARMMERMDADGDGEVSFDEMPGQQTRQDRMFDRLDADNDGAISAEEMDAAQARMQERMKDGRGDRGERGMRRGDGPRDGHGKMHRHDGQRYRN